MSEYLLINFLTILFPLVLSFERKIRYYKKLPAVFASILIVGGVYVFWDAIATLRGDWSFNQQFVNGIRIFNLPVEEILFFVTVPYSALFLYETAVLYLPEKKIIINPKIFYGLSAVLFLAALINTNRYYTFTVLMFSSFFILFNLFSKYSLLKSKIYHLWILFMFIPFLVVNYFLTSLPVVMYSPGAIIGVRFITIPVEDFFYSYSMLSFNLFVYLIVKEKWLLKRK